MSWKLLFIMLKINELIIKLFLPLYLVIIYDSYIFIYVCAYVYHEYSGTWLCICISCFPCYLGLKMTATFYLYTIIRFNMAYWFYLKSIPIWGCCTIISLVLLHVILDGVFILIYVCIYVMLIEMTLSCNPLVICFWR